MSNGPTDFESGYIFESQKRIQDRRNALGVDDGPTRSTSWTDDASSGSGRDHWIVAVLIGFVWLVAQLLKVVVPLALYLAWETAKLLGRIIGAILFSGRR